MNEKETWFLSMVSIVLLALGGMFLISMEFSKGFDGLTKVGTTLGEEPKVSVIGTAKLSVVPDEAVLMLTISTLNNDASLSQSENAALFEELKAYLLVKGIKEKDIETVYYNMELEEEKNWINGNYVSTVVGYKTTHSIKVTLSEVEEAGEIADLAVEKGAEVNYISFQLSEKKKAELENQLISDAVLDAQYKAYKIASASDLDIGNMINAEYGAVNYPYQYYYSAELLMGSSSGDAKTSLAPGEMEISVSVSTVFELVPPKLL